MPSMFMRLFAFFCMFMLLAGPRFNVLDLNLLFTMLLSMGGFAYLFLAATLSRALVVLNLILISFLASGCVSSLLSGAQYFETLAHFFRAFLSFWAAFFVVKIYQKIYSDGQSYEAFCRSFEVSFFVNCCFVVLVMFVEPVKQFATTQLSQNSKMAALANESVRSVDLVIGGGAVASLIFSVFFVFSFSRFLCKKNVFSMLCMLAALMAAMFTGRSGLVAIFLCPIPTLLLFNYLTYGRFRIISVMKLSAVVLLGAIVALVTLFLFLNIMFPMQMGILLDNSFAWSFEPFINYYYTGSFSSSSTSDLLRMYEKGVSFSDVFSFFGNSRTGRDDYYLPTDIGYIRALFTSGFVGFLLIFGKYVFMMAVASIGLASNKFEKSQVPVVIALVYYLVVIFLANFKEYHQTIRVGFPMLMMFFILLYGGSRLRQR